MDFLSADSLPWLKEAQQRLRESRAANRLPQSCLLLSPPGLGALLLANWMAALALCDSRDDRPCGACPSCSLLRSDSHPDFHVVRLEDDAKQIKVDQVRELIGDLALKSYRRGYKVGLIDGAETLNVYGANAFLKTLEEPGADTMLVLIARPTHRLPATIASRCVRLVLRPPLKAEGIAWLQTRGSSPDAGPTAPRTADAAAWGAALDLAAGAPLLALEYDPAATAALEAQMQAAMRALAAGTVDVTLLAQEWVKSNLALRLAWLENWITACAHAYLGRTPAAQSAEPVRLPAGVLKPKIRGLFGLLDGVRDLKGLASTNVNQQLALEALLLGGRSALGP